MVRFTAFNLQLADSQGVSLKDSVLSEDKQLAETKEGKGNAE